MELKHKTGETQNCATIVLIVPFMELKPDVHDVNSLSGVLIVPFMELKHGKVYFRIGNGRSLNRTFYGIETLSS